MNVPEAVPLKVGIIMLGVQDLDRALAFYTKRLNLALRGRAGDFAFLDGGGVMITLSAQLWTTRATGAKSPVEIVLQVDSVMDAYESLRGRGIVFLNEPRSIDGSNHAANFEDPDGHLLSIWGPQ
jgi:catechol 2,3-dioxygenase-like lactoylglutathione lyase family enzyme